MHSPASGGSLSSFWLTVAPLPSHTFTWQSPATWTATGVPAAVKLAPHTPWLQVKVAHSESTPQSDADAHAGAVTQAPLLQVSPAAQVTPHAPQC